MHHSSNRTRSFLLGALLACASCSSEDPEATTGASAGPGSPGSPGTAGTSADGGTSAAVFPPTGVGAGEGLEFSDGGAGGCSDCGEGGEGGAEEVYLPSCGNGIVDSDHGEACDDANQDGGDGCTAACDQIEADYVCPTPGQACVYTVECGDGKVGGAETCDDGVDEATGVPVAGDGCSTDCAIEDGYACPAPGVACRPVCGDGLVLGREQCDDGADATEGVPVAGDGCDANCALEDGWVCAPGEPCRETVCGDGVAEGSEQCDDGNLQPYDGCSPHCAKDPACGSDTSPIGACRSDCGDGIVLAGAGEECDDGNLLSGDGCDEECRFEVGYACTTQGDTPPEVLEIPIVYRDFNESGSDGGHPDFETPNNVLDPRPSSDVHPGIVEDLLGADRKPIYACAAAAPCPQTTSPETFAQWYHDVDDINLHFDSVLELNREGDAYVMDSAADEPWASLGGFFPLDGEGFGNQGSRHNYHFTSELRYWFEYRGGEELTFSGDDDVWVFINGRLAVDLGGVHNRRAGTVVLDAETGHGQSCVANYQSSSCVPAGDIDFSLELGSVYEVVVFQAERRRSESNYWLTLANFTAESSDCEPVCGDGVRTADEACDLGDELNTGEHGGCNPDCTLAPYCGDGALDEAAGEQCDDGVNTSTYGGCAPGCLLGPFCGDGQVQPAYEDCDDGTNSSTYGGCSANCRYAPRCGDGVVDSPEEECDDGRDNGSTNCLVDCTKRGIY